MRFRAGNKFRISWQSFIECLLLSHFRHLFKLLTLTEGRAYPSTNNAHRKTLIENDHCYVQAVFWISSQRYREEKKRKKVLKPFVVSHTQPMHVPNQISFPLILAGNCYKFILQHFLSILYSPFSNKRNQYFFKPGRILKKIIKHSACKHLEESIDITSSLPGFIKNKPCHNNIIFIHHQIASSVCWGKAVHII